MMNARDFDFEVKPNEGMGPIHFGMTIVEVTSILGIPTKMEEKTDETIEVSYTLLSYDDMQSSFFFSGESRTLDSIDTTNPECTLNGTKLFKLNVKKASNLMKSMGFEDIECEKIDGYYETGVYVVDAGIDLYFENDKLTSMMISDR